MRCCISLGAFVVAWLAILGVTNAQNLPTPKIVRVLPTGGKAGTSFEVTVAGSDLSEVETLHFSFPGAKVEVLDAARLIPMPTKGKAAIKGMAPVSASAAQLFKVTLPPSAPLGIHDVRLVTKNGISNPRTFIVGELNEIDEKESNDDVPVAQSVELTTVISGVIDKPTDVDFFRFTGKKGQRLIASCLTSSIDSRLPAMLELFQQMPAASKFLGSNRNYRENDALLEATLPDDGEYYLRLSSFTYTQGGPDCFYRLTLSSGPWIDAVFPSAIEIGKEAKITVYGRNLGGTAASEAMIEGKLLEKIVVTVKGLDAKNANKLDFAGYLDPSLAMFDGISVSTKTPFGGSNTALLIASDVPVVAEVEPNNTNEKPQTLTAPCMIAGRIDAAGDRDCFAFAAKKGQVLAVDAYADRFSRPADLRISIADAKGKSLLDLDDSTDVAYPAFYTRSDDPPSGRFTAPEDGTYVLTVIAKDSYSSHGPRNQYLVRLAPPKPDFTVVAVPSSTTTLESASLQVEGTYAWTALVFPKDGFNGNIRIEGVDLPPGVSVKPQTIRVVAKAAAPKGPTMPIATIVASASSGSYAGPIKLIATAEVEGRKIVRDVRAGGMVWPVPQANVPAVARLERELVVAVRGKADYALQWTQPDFKAAAGEPVKVGVKLKVLNPNFKTPVQVAPVVAPPGLTAQPLTLAPGKESGTLILDAKGTSPAGKFSLVLKGQTAPPPKQQPPKNAPQNIQQYSMPLDVILTPKALAKITPPGNPLKVSLGKSAEASIKIARQFDYSGPFTIEPIADMAPKGVTFSATKTGNDDETAKLTVTAAQDAPPGPAVIPFRVIGTFEGMPIAHEAKLAVVIGK
ncbi:MAG: PPC domain-containing protein [Gemmataceae bacterium]|nr:PPC domain-containing protein [Gemmataceae bacterium]